MRRRRAQDSRPHWNDPNLPCIRNYKMANGKVMTEVDADYERRYREHLIRFADNPSWRNDPTYNLKRRK